MKKITNTIVSLSLLVTTAMLSPNIAIAEESSSPPTQTTETTTDTNNNINDNSELVSGEEITKQPFSPDESGNTTNN